MRFFFEISYNGKHYSGWQSQNNAIGVQAKVEDGLSKILRENIKIVGSGRTDAGVHCTQQFFHVDIEKSFEPQQIQQRLNSFLPADIAIHSIRQVVNEASARYNAIDRTYHYHITFDKNPFLEGYAWHYFKPLNVQTMNEAAALIKGVQDFKCFSKVKTDVNHFLCEIKRAEWIQEDNLLVFKITANRFLRGMVRAIVGTLTDVGIGKTSIQNFKDILQSGDRKTAGANVPPYGLYLVEVKYPESIFVHSTKHTHASTL